MDIFLYIMIFIMGTVFGSFFTLAVYRIPLKKDITHERSFCPNCEHRLEFLDLIPIFSYLFLKGKCRYCGEKVRIRYLLLEILSGIVFLVTYLSFNIQNVFLDFNKLIYFIFFVLMYVTLVIIAGIDKEYRKIESSVLAFGVICHAIYILYLYIVEGANIYRYGIYFAICVLLWISNNILHKKKKTNYILQILMLISYIIFVLGVKSILPIIFIGLLLTLIYFLITKKTIEEIPYGFILSISTILCKIVENFIKFY